MIILGLDPGSLQTGYGLLEKAALSGSSFRVIAAGRLTGPRDLALPARLARLVAGLQELLDRHPPDLAVLESPFHGMNSHSLIVLAQARGALLASLAGRGIEIREYTPAEVKSAVTGNGRADKTQVARMVHLLLGVKDRGWPSDATDALAVALCCGQRLRLDRLRESPPAR